ncbi:centrosomal AT-AC splicing factor-like isoform X1 [Ornithodoros turicata]|uniref:centrosomal AT-AC splicing factor-like isoform X1 n=1 Tax=Ornithodoros turicata TaxID=34597 RepID=UPI0031390BE3
MSASFTQYVVCELCNINHNLGKKHVYSRKHQQIVSNVLTKFAKKIADAKHSMKTPEIYDVQWEPGAKAWCYFCVSEVEKHERDIDLGIAVKCRSFLLHLTSSEHLAACKHFFWKNKISKARVSHYVMESSLLDRYEVALKVAKEKYLQKVEALHKKVVEDIRTMEACRKAAFASEWLTSQSGLPASSTQALTGTATQPGCSSWTNRPVNGRQAPSLRPKGNIFSGARPPWLDGSDDDDDGTLETAAQPTIGEISNSPIGPSGDDFRKQVEKEKRNRLNPNRVGANFDHDSATSEDWLPSFGRVWNFGRRWQSRHQYRKEEKEKQQK